MGEPIIGRLFSGTYRQLGVPVNRATNLGRALRPDVRRRQHWPRWRPPPWRAGSESVASAERPKRAAEAISSMRSSLRLVTSRVEDARNEKDVVKLNCVNEKLAQIKGLLKVAEQSEVAMKGADRQRRPDRQRRVRQDRHRQDQGRRAGQRRPAVHRAAGLHRGREDHGRGPAAGRPAGAGHLGAVPAGAAAVGAGGAAAAVGQQLPLIARQAPHRRSRIGPQGAHGNESGGGRW